jgi:hypothetical protein
MSAPGVYDDHPHNGCLFVIRYALGDSIHPTPSWRPGILECGVDLFCIQNGGIGPFGSPVAQIHCDSDGYCMVGSRVFSQYEPGGTFDIDWKAQKREEIRSTVSQINKTFVLIARNLGLDPNAEVPVSIQYKSGVWNVALWNCTANCKVNQDANGSGWLDPITFMHKGDPSWYYGNVFGFDVGHVIGSDPASAHIDPFGPLNPLHYVIQLPAMIFPGGPTGYTRCSINGGCE